MADSPHLRGSVPTTKAEVLHQNEHEQETTDLEEGPQNIASRPEIPSNMEGIIGINLPGIHTLLSTDPPQPRRPALQPMNQRVRQLAESESPPPKRRKNAKANNDEINPEPQEYLEIPKPEAAHINFGSSQYPSMPKSEAVDTKSDHYQHPDTPESDIVYSQPEPPKRPEIGEPKLANQWCSNRQLPPFESLNGMLGPNLRR